MRMKKQQRREPPENTIPLINVVFLMLIFFLFAGSIARDDARQIKPPVNILEDETIRSTGALIIDPQGRTYGGEIEMTVTDWLAQREETSEEDGPIKVAADGTLKADALEKVLKDLKEAGRRDIVLITRRGAQ
ncbi:biopolymer transporter ExbD [Labrenzia sp. 011]|uniref:ExbD/TolR family protein n=1 Tax=Labrenzia sp. 011 TaxID=2171494 RepID=UPI000D512EC5|nr:biopolymer transporter ExbD [Labrenzia sp. 011]PVB62396.1 biopolymer transporter ExbD [Labrenzia sp. 011]